MKLEEARELVQDHLRSFHMQDETLVYHTLSFLVESERGPLWRQYLLNPTVSQDDIIYTIVAFIGVTLLRLMISGGNSGTLRSLPCISKKVAKSMQWVRKGKLHKFGENTWYTLWHGSATLWGIYVLYSENGTQEMPGWPQLHMGNPDGRWYWMASPEEFARGSGGWPLLVPSVATRNYYLFQLAFWFSCLAFINVETKRSDYGILLLHHFLTVILVGFSYCCSYWKVGVVILMLHDMADVFLYLAKTLHYSHIQSGAVEVSFVTFVIVFFITRLIIFPLYCVIPSLNITLISALTQDFVESRWRIPGGTILPGFLVVLQVMHVYWFWCIIRMAVGLIGAIRSGSRENCEDVRSDDEGECEVEDQKPALAGKKTQ